MRRLPWQQETMSNASIDHILSLGGGVLVVGAAGQGREFFIERLARRALCLTATTGDACGQCSSCMLGEHPDLHKVSPEGTKQIGIDSIRSLSDKLHQTAQQGGARVAIIDPVQRMTLASVNALLKTLEEPGANTTLILGCDRVSQVLPTVRSRCRIINLEAATQEQSVSWLAMQGYQAEQIEGALQACMNQPLLAEQMLENGNVGQYNTFAQELNEVIAGQLDPVRFANGWAKEAIVVTVGWWIQTLRQRLNGASELEQLLLHRFYQELTKQLMLASGPSNLSAAMMLEQLAVAWFQLGRKINYSNINSLGLHERSVVQ